MTAQKVQSQLQHYADLDQAKTLARFFKTAKGEYGEGDQFIGINVPTQRKIAKKFQDLSFIELQILLQNPIHEFRLTALLILVEKFQSTDLQHRQGIVDFYLNNTRYINNWDLVDLSAYKILGAWLLDKPQERKILVDLAHSDHLWEKRIALIATMAFIKAGDYHTTLQLVKILIFDQHDLIQKAVGWMLREIGKKDQQIEEDFLQQYYKTMPRTSLRYAIEKFDPAKRQFYLAK